MAARRSSGEGSVFQTANGRWVAMIELARRADGRRQRVARRARTRAEAQRKLRELRAQMQDHGGIESSTRTVAESVADYIERVRQPADQRTGTRNKDKMLANAVTAHLGSRKVADLSVQDVEALLAGFASGRLNASGRPVSRDYVRRLRAFIAAVVRNDMRLGLVHRNVAELATIPRSEVTAKNRRALTIDEWRLLYDSATGTTKLLVDLCGRHGLRPQEARALQWSTTNLDDGELSVTTQLDSNDQEVPTKTAKSTRTIYMHADLLEELRRWKNHQDQLRAKASQWSDLGLVLTTRVGTPIRQENQRRSLNLLCQKLGIDPITPYELRHTALTHQVEARNPVSQIADWAGTSEKMIYEHYRHQLREVVGLQPPEYLQ